MILEKFKFSFLLQPLLVSIHPCLLLFDIGINESYFYELVTTSLIILSFATLLFYWLSFLLKSYSKSSVFLTVFMLIFLNIGAYVRSYAYSELFGIRFFRWRYFLPILLVVLIFLLLRLYKSRRQPCFLATFLIWPLLFFNIYEISRIVVRNNKCYQLINSYDKVNKKFWNKHFNVSKLSNLDKLPNVYYIILDKYASNETLKRYYDYDNSDFLNNLLKKGFYIPKESFSNYLGTPLSVSSSLNMNYHKALSFLYDYWIALGDYMMKNNNVTNYFLLKGYKYLHAPSHSGYSHYFSFGEKESCIGFLKRYWERVFLGTNSYVAMVLQRSVLCPFWAYFWHEKMREVVLKQLSILKHAVELKGPHFIFAHILCPHGPYIFDKNGNSTYGYWKESHKDGYVDQVIFINREIENVIDYILKNSKVEPIIILQGDHGVEQYDHGTVNEDGPYKFALSKSLPLRYQKMLFGNLNAYYFPRGRGKEILEGHISPVNNFRIIFNNYLKSSFKLLKDSSFLGPTEEGEFLELDRLVPVT